jgi:ABC-type nitrate/sulfonate/bicarbonate transport system permease component
LIFLGELSNMQTRQKNQVVRVGLNGVLLTLLLILVCLAPRSARAFESSSVLTSYCIGGAALGSLVGSAGATVAYFNDKQGFDFLVGAGAGAVGGCGLGVILGVIDLGLRRSQPSASAPGTVPVFAWRPGGGTLGLNVTF